MGRHLLQNDHKTGLRARLVQGVGHAIEQGVKVLAGLRRKGELLGNHVQHVLFALGHGQVGIQKVMPQVLCSRVQILYPVGAD
jgi:hypothetical protein